MKTHKTLGFLGYWFGGRRFLLLGVLAALGALRFIRAPLGALGENSLPFWKPFGIHRDWVHELVVDSQYPRIFVLKTDAIQKLAPAGAPSPE